MDMSVSELSHNPPGTLRRRTGLVHDPFFALHEVIVGPEVAERLAAIESALGQAGIRNHLFNIPARNALQKEICLVHTPAYFRRVRKDVEFGSGQLSTGDTELSHYSLEVAMRATGGVLEAVDAVCGQETIINAFCAVRPPGHHACRNKGMGFCIFNHIGIAARYAQKKHGIHKVLIVDWDVHHGNGTQEAFYEDGSVLFFSSHQWPLYPGTGKRKETGSGRARGLIINAPLPPGSGYAEILGEMETRLEPAIARFKPELVLISAGFDAQLGDPLGRFTITDREFALLTRRVMDWAEDFAGGRIVSVLEGGYNLDTLGSAVAAHVRALARIDDE